MRTVYLYNTLTRKKEEFVPLEAGKAGIYSCGPTVYAYAHIGNMRAYVFADILRRIMEYAGYDVTHVMNITDVGHLVSDGDEGEDKMELGKRRENLDAWGLAEKYTDAFFGHAAKLHIRKPQIVCKATDHIPEQIAMIEKLEAGGYTYVTDDGVYFDTTKFAQYGDMAKLDIEGLQSGKRIDDSGKRNKTDFALWKFSPKDAQRDMEWDSPWGKGFPGWHIECSAMSSKYLGEQFDIHTGGIDHIPVHHTNEIAQSECASGHAPFVKYWLHCEFLSMDDSVKMSKSKGDVFTVDTLIEKGYDPLALRYLYLTSHYRNPVKFSYASLDAAAVTLKKLTRNILSLRSAAEKNVTLSEKAKAYQERFAAAVCDDLNTAIGLAELHALLSDGDLSDAEKYALATEFDLVFGFDFADMADDSKEETPPEVLDLVAKRDAARQAKDWAEADRLRAAIAEKGYAVEDTADGAKIVKAS
jgi:cysteinyl-tRNA synthetase